MNTAQLLETEDITENLVRPSSNEDGKKIAVGASNNNSKKLHKADVCMCTSRKTEDT